jgi:hypothetical protein
MLHLLSNHCVFQAMLATYINDSLVFVYRDTQLAALSLN